MLLVGVLRSEERASLGAQQNRLEHIYKNNMNTDAERYVDKHPKFKVRTEHYIAVV